MRAGKVFVGTIIASVPESGIALVATGEGTANLDSMYISTFPVPDGDIGVTPQANYPDGTAVICVKARENSKAFIAGPANYAIGDIHDSLAGNALYRVDEYADAENKTFKQLLCDLLSNHYKEVRYQAHGEDLNVLPGDWDAIDTSGNVGLHVGRTVTQLRGSAFAFIDAVGVTNTIRVVAQNIEKHMALSVKMNRKGLDVNNLAVSDSEAFGLESSTPFIVEDDTPQFKDPDAIPLYRLQSIAGAAADGVEHTVVSFPYEQSAHYCTTEPPILYKYRASLSGAVSEASAASLLSIKSPAIVSLQQVCYDAEGDPTSQPDILQPYQPEEPKEEKTESLDIDDTAINKLLDKLFTDDYVGKLVQKLAEHGLAVSTGDGSLAKSITGTIETGPSLQQEYGLPPSIKLTDPVSGKETVYYASTSFISQEPDGSILIRDGYGSEIRMMRGNIYISPALDLFLRPGRDLSSMVPRYQTFNAQKHTTINSSDSVYVRAAHDMKLVAATAKNGVLTIENRAAGSGEGNGILVKSTTGLSLLGTDVYIGRARNGSQVKNRVEEPADPGSIIIDAGANGIIYERSAEQTLDSVALNLVGNAQAAIRITGNLIGLYSEGVEVTGHVVVATKKRPEVVNLWRDSQPQQFQLVQATDPSVSIDGSLGVDGYVICNESMKVCGDMYAQNVATRTGEVYMASYQNGDPFAREPFEKLEGRNDMGYFAAESLKSASQSIYQDYYTAVNSFEFPQYGVALAVMPGMVWQADNMDADVGGRWKEEPVISVIGGSSTMCYPGADVWADAKVSYRNNKKMSLLDGYVTNT